MKINTIRFDNDRLFIIDQTRLPEHTAEIELSDLDQAIDAIKKLKVRGAPAIGITAAYAFYLETKRLINDGADNDQKILAAADKLKQARPTAVNLEWAVNRMMNVFVHNRAASGSELMGLLRQSALDIHEEDRETCRKIGENGAEIVQNGFHILTHCNAGILATGGLGTALAVIYTAHNQKKNVHVYVDETRPLGQGTRLTYWELKQHNVPATLITDNVAASLMRRSKIDLIIVGADRITMNGDFANKIGTYNLAVLARYHNIPFYCAAPSSTFDRELENGENIPVEIRDKSEVTALWGIGNHDFYDVYNPAFDVTPGELLTGIITEKGIINKPYKQNINTFLIN